jgi:hypothetical protein
MIKLIRLKGNEPSSNVRIALNSNLELIEVSLNKIDSILNLSSGTFDNTNVNSNVIGEVKTQKVTVTTNGITLNAGNVDIKTGKLVIESDTAEIDLNQGVKLVKYFYANGNTPIYSVNLSSMFKIKGYSSAELIDIEDPDGGVLAFNSTTKKLVLYDGTGWSNLN